MAEARSQGIDVRISRMGRSTSQDIGDVSDTINAMNGTIRMLRQQLTCKDSLIEAMKQRLEIMERDKDISARQIATYEERLDYQSRTLLNYNELKESNEVMEQELSILINRSQHLESVTQSYNNIEDLYINLSNKLNLLQSEQDQHRGMEEKLKMAEASNIELKILVKQLQFDLSNQIDESKTLGKALSVQQEIDIMHNQIETNALENKKLLHQNKSTKRSLGIISTELSTLLTFDASGINSNDILNSLQDNQINRMREAFKANIQNVYSALKRILISIKHDEDSETLVHQNSSFPGDSVSSSSPVESLVRWILKLLETVERCHDDRFKLFTDLESAMQTLNSSVYTVEKLNNRVLRYKNVFQVFDLTVPNLLDELEAVFTDDYNPQRKNTALLSSTSASFSPSSEGADMITSKDRLTMIDKLQKRISELVHEHRKLKDCRELLESSRQSVYQLESSCIRLKQEHAQELEKFRNEIHDYRRICAESEEAVRILEIESKTEIHRIKDNFDEKLSLKLQEMSLRNNESLHDVSINDGQTKDLSVCLHRLLIYTLQLQGKYLDVVTQKTVLLRLCQGYFSLRKDVEVLAHGCISSQNQSDNNGGWESDETNIAIDDNRLSNDYDFSIVEMTRYRSGSNRPIKTIRVVAIYILAALRWKKLTYEKAMISISQKLRGESYAHLTPSYMSPSPYYSKRSKNGKRINSSSKFSSFDINVDTDLSMSGESRLRICTFSRYRIPLHPEEWILPSHAELEHVSLHSAMDNILYALTALPATASKQHYHSTDSHSTPSNNKPSSSSTSHQWSPPAKSLLDIICSKSYDRKLRRSLETTHNSSHNMQRGHNYSNRYDKYDKILDSQDEQMISRIWYQRSGGVDLFGQLQVTLLQRALVSMSKRLRNLVDQIESLKGQISKLEENDQRYARLLNESLTALNNQAGAIELLDRQRLASTTHNFVASAEEILGKLSANNTLTTRLQQEESVQLKRSNYFDESGQIPEPVIIGGILSAPTDVPIVKLAAAYAATNETSNSKFPVWKTTSSSRVSFSSSGMINSNDLLYIPGSSNNFLDDDDDDDDDSYHISSDEDVSHPTIQLHKVDLPSNRAISVIDRLNKSYEDGNSSTGISSLNNSFATAVEDYQ